MSPRGRSLVILALLAAVLQCAGTLVPGPHLWGVHHYAFLPTWIQALALVILIVTFLPATRDPLAERLAGVASGFSSSAAARRAVIVTLCIAAVVFWLGRSRTFFMSDGELLLRDIQRGVLSAFEADTLSAPFHLWFHHLLRDTFGVASWTASFRIASIGAGIVWIACVMAIVGRLTKDGAARFFLAGLLVTAGMTRLFYGYVETSPLFAAAVAVYTWAAIRCLDEGKGVVALVAAFTLAVAMHVTAFLFFPSLLFVLLRHGGPERTRRPALLAASLVPFLALPLFWLVRGGGEKTGSAFEAYMTKFVPLSGPLLPKQAYTFLSLPHLAEFMNEQVLLGPVAFFGFVTVLLFALRGKGAKLPSSRGDGTEGPGRADRAPHDAGRDGAIPHLAGFLVVMAIPILVLSLVYNRELGGARDWDLLANLTLPCLLLVGLAVLEESEGALAAGRRGGRKPTGVFPRIAVSLIGVSMVHLAGWVLIDAEAVRSMNHLKALFPPEAPVSRFARAYAFEEMGRSYMEGGDFGNARVCFETALAIDPSDMKAVGPLAHLSSMAGDHEAAARYYREAGRLRPDNAASFLKLAGSLTALGRTGEAADAYRRCLDIDSEQPAAWQDFGNLLFGMGDLAAARAAYREALVLKPGDPDLGFNIGLTLEHEGKDDEALAAYRAVLAAHPLHLAALFGSGTLLLRTGRFEESLALFSAVLDIQPGARDASINLALANAQLGRFPEAGAGLERTATFDERVAGAYIDVAKVAEAHGKISEAVFILTSCRMRDGRLADQLGAADFVARLQTIETRASR